MGRSERKRVGRERGDEDGEEEHVAAMLRQT